MTIKTLQEYKIMIDGWDVPGIADRPGTKNYCEMYTKVYQYSINLGFELGNFKTIPCGRLMCKFQGTDKVCNFSHNSAMKDAREHARIDLRHLREKSLSSPRSIPVMVTEGHPRRPILHVQASVSTKPCPKTDDEILEEGRYLAEMRIKELIK